MRGEQGLQLVREVRVVLCAQRRHERHEEVDGRRAGRRTGGRASAAAAAAATTGTVYTPYPYPTPLVG